MQSKAREDRIAGKGFTSMSHYNLGHKFILVPQAMNPDAKAAVDRECDWGQVKSNKEVTLEAQRDKKKVHVASLMDICHLKNAELEPFFQQYKGRIVLRV